MTRRAGSANWSAAAVPSVCWTIWVPIQPSSISREVKRMSDAPPNPSMQENKNNENHRISQEFHDRLLLEKALDDEINQAVLQPMLRTGPWFWIIVCVLAAIVIWGLYAWIYQIYWGIGVVGKNRPVYWGTYIATFVFWVGISHAGTMISAVLRIFKADWRRPITRGAEAMTAFALLMAGLYPLIHLGRVWKFYWMVPYPNNR